MRKERQTVYLGQYVPPEVKLDQNNNVIAVYSFISESCKEYIAQGWEIKSVQQADPLTDETGNALPGIFNVKVQMVRDMFIEASNCEVNK